MFSQRPDRWRAVVAEVPFVDVVSTMFDSTIPLTINEWDEWGDPRQREEFDAMLAYSPYDNLPGAGGRPDLLVTGALHDPRVMVFEPAKWVAALRATDPAWAARCVSGVRPEPAPTSVRRDASRTWPTRPRSTPGCWTGSATCDRRRAWPYRSPDRGGLAALIDAELGGQHVIRDAGLLSVALARPQAAALLILALNGVRLTAGDEELFALTMTMASGELRDVPLIAAQLEDWAVPLEGGDHL